ncbi:MAG: hypothetical protein J4G05_01005 [Chlorobi bacterium]|nr:hypothetical protein [Chlorobiota bacterium]
MSIRTVEIERLQAIADREDLLPKELRSLGLVLVFDILYNAEAYTRNSEERGGFWGVHFSHRLRREADVKLYLHDYLATEERFFRNSRGASQSHHVYIITMKGFELLRRLKKEAGIE